MRTGRCYNRAPVRRFLLRRLLLVVPGLLGMTLLVFAAARLAPGDPVAALGDGALQPDAATVAALREYRERMGLDGPLLRGWLLWLWNLLHGDLGFSLRDGLPVTAKLAHALPVTLALSGAALVLSWLVAVPLGVFAALRARSLADRVLTAGLFLLYSLPVQWVALLLVVTLGIGAGLPFHGLRSDAEEARSLLDTLAHLVLPLVCLAYLPVARLSRHVRSAMLEVLGQDFVRAARARGLPERVVIVRHALRAALLPLVTLLGLALPSLVGGAVVVERIFGLPGMGRLAFDAVLQRDVPVLMATTAVAGAVTMLGVLVSDLLYGAVDPRVRPEPR